jgi:hypothetical protein
MKRGRRLRPELAALAVTMCVWAGCAAGRPSSTIRTAATSQSTPTSIGATVPEPSPRLIIGRVIAVDATQGFAFVELVPDAPRAATVAETELISRTLELRETARLSASRQLRGRTLGTIILSGKPAPGDEVVWLAP